MIILSNRPWHQRTVPHHRSVISQGVSCLPFVLAIENYFVMRSWQNEMRPVEKNHAKHTIDNITLVMSASTGHILVHPVNGLYSISVIVHSMSASHNRQQIPHFFSTPLTLCPFDENHVGSLTHIAVDEISDSSAMVHKMKRFHKYYVRI